MTAEQYVRHEPAAKIVRTGILRIFECSVRKALVLVTFGRGKHAVYHAADAVREDTRGKLASRENVIAD